MLGIVKGQHTVSYLVYYLFRFTARGREKGTWRIFHLVCQNYLAGLGTTYITLGDRKISFATPPQAEKCLRSTSALGMKALQRTMLLAGEYFGGFEGGKDTSSAL